MSQLISMGQKSKQIFIKKFQDDFEKATQDFSSGLVTAAECQQILTKLGIIKTEAHIF